jgi:hypothetical protein
MIERRNLIKPKTSIKKENTIDVVVVAADLKVIIIVIVVIVVIVIVQIINLQYKVEKRPLIEVLVKNDLLIK